MKSTTQEFNEITEILTKGAAFISPEEDIVLKAFEAFATDHPDHVFLSKKERYEQNAPLLPEEEQLWREVQPILDKCHGCHGPRKIRI